MEDYGYEATEIDRLIETGRRACIITTNGYWIREAVIEAQDLDVIIYRAQGVRQMIYKRAISTIVLE